jgi:hypothetical protein
MIELLFKVLLFFVSSSDAAALVRTDRQDITDDIAAEHIAAARFAGAAHGVDANLLLSIAWHESRYNADAVGPESGGRVSCGPMTPVPRARCQRQHIVLGYLDGARHLREWISTTASMNQALLGYAGGYRMINACAEGPVLRKGRGDDLCKTPDVFIGRARWIREEMHRKSRATS